MSGNAPGANPDEAYKSGGDGVTVAETFKGLVKAFETAMGDLDTASAEKPVNGAFSELYNNHWKSLQDVEDLGRDITTNVQAGASRVASTDREAASEYLRSPSPYFKSAPNPTRPPFIAPKPPNDPDGHVAPLLNRRVNGLTDPYMTPGTTTPGS